jgi:hypothetical protein
MSKDKKIDGKITFGELEGDFTPEELEAMRQERIEATRKTIEELGIKKGNSKHLVTIDGYREIIEIRKKKGVVLKSDEELDAYCMERFGEPFFKK